jgi:uncharacterized membrane protein
MHVFDFVYRFLREIGYTHPIHPTEVHMPIGLVVGGLVFALTALLFQRQTLSRTARHCIILAFIWVFPTMLLGYMDWQHYYAGVYMLPIKVKLVLGPVLAVLLLAVILLGKKYGPASKHVLPVYFLSFCTVVVLGYFGGQLVFGSGTSPTSRESFQAGEKIFVANCKSCHPHGGNIIRPDLPMNGAPELKDPETFLAFIRNPMMPSGSRGAMPAFSPSKVSNAQAEELFRYITNVLEKSRISRNP